MNYLRIIILLTIFSFALGCQKDDSHTPSAGYIKPDDFLSDKKYKTLIVEINYVQGYMPTEEAVDNMVTFLSERLNKPRGSRTKRPFTNEKTSSSQTPLWLGGLHQNTLSRRDQVRITM